jgi:uncharacterized membrane protein
MFSLPEPLHPAVVHFPIVLLLIGAAVAVVTVFLNRWHLPWTAAALLVLGAAGTFVATQTGESAQEVVGELPPAVEDLLDEHEEWGERTEIVAGITGGLAVVAAALGAFAARRIEDPALASGPLRKLAFATRTLAAVAALVACFFVYQTAHRGGKLVYEHGVGIKSAPGEAGAPTIGHRDDD